MRRTNVRGKLRPNLLARAWLVFGFWLGLFATYLLVENHGQSVALGAGAWFQFAAFFSTLLLYSILKYGPFMHAVPYALSLIGAALLFMSEAKQPGTASAFFLAMTAFIHAVVVYDMRNDQRSSKTT